MKNSLTVRAGGKELVKIQLCAPSKARICICSRYIHDMCSSTTAADIMLIYRNNLNRGDIYGCPAVK